MKKIILLLILTFSFVGCQNDQFESIDLVKESIDGSAWQDSLVEVGSKEPNSARYATPVPVHGLVTLGDQNARGNFRLNWSQDLTDMTILVVLLDGTIWFGEGHDSRNVRNVRGSDVIHGVYFTGIGDEGIRISGEVLLQGRRDELVRNADIYADLGVDNLADAVGDEFYIYYYDTSTYIKFSNGFVRSYVNYAYDVHDNYVYGCIENTAYTTRLGVYRIEYGTIVWTLDEEDQPDISVFEIDIPNGYYPGKYRVPADTNTTYRHPAFQYAHENGVLFLNEADFIASPNTSYHARRRICSEDPIAEELTRNGELYDALGVDSLEELLGDEFYAFYFHGWTYLKFKNGVVNSYVSRGHDAQNPSQEFPGCINEISTESKVGEYRIEHGRIIWTLDGQAQPDIEDFTIYEETGQITIPSSANPTDAQPAWAASPGILYPTEEDLINDEDAEYGGDRIICTQAQIDSQAGSTPELAVETYADLIAAIDLGFHDFWYVKHTETGAIVRFTTFCGDDDRTLHVQGAPHDGSEDFALAFSGVLEVDWLGLPCKTAYSTGEYSTLQDKVLDLVTRGIATNYGVDR
ncbi:hypothetical protein [Pelagibaculum spongiae]|uniref:Uncharacterized protein n=1 Tax=Pelagibaculum spongiae TaxID=2080658 RepID=A0A2V1GZC8_9GAMM|nr:hypothetical protein [Pelagibaculum spongiae]PVZ72404.1 hypothetical protein DC094_05200 [Pelagibaculum spongiae]